MESWGQAFEPQELGQKRVRAYPNTTSHTTFPASRVNAFTAPGALLRELPNAEMPLHNALPCKVWGVWHSQGRLKTAQAFDAASRRRYLDTSSGIPLKAEATVCKSPAGGTLIMYRIKVNCTTYRAQFPPFLLIFEEGRPRGSDIDHQQRNGVPAFLLLSPRYQKIILKLAELQPCTFWKLA